jgi:hypothetical protein
VIVADRREGGILPEADKRSGIAPVWRNLDRNVPLWLKLIVPVIVVTLLGTGGLGFAQAIQTNNNVEAAYVDTATADGRAAANTFYNAISDPTGVNQYLADVAGAEPNVRGIWIVNLVVPSTPVIASSRQADIGFPHRIDQNEIELVESGQSVHEKHTIAGEPVLEVIVPVKGNAFAVVVETSLKTESQALTSTLISAAVVALSSACWRSRRWAPCSKPECCAGSGASARLSTRSAAPRATRGCQRARSRRAAMPCSTWPAAWIRS